MSIALAELNKLRSGTNADVLYPLSFERYYLRNSSIACAVCV